MDHIGFEFFGQLLNDEGIVRAFVDANSAADAQAFRDVGFARAGIHDDALLPVSYRGAVGMALVVALLWLATVLAKNSDAHGSTRSTGHGVTL
jgi:hypothetical protein